MLIISLFLLITYSLTYSKKKNYSKEKYLCEIGTLLNIRCVFGRFDIQGRFEKYLYLQLKYIVKIINICRISIEYSQAIYN